MRYKTERKEEVLRFFKDNADHAFTVEEVCLGILDGGVGESSVYRIVSDYTAEGKLKRLKDSSSRKNYYQYLGENDCGAHLHLKCGSCGRLIHLSHRETSALCEGILLSQGFSIDSKNTLFGICLDCRRKSTSNERTAK